MQYKRILVRATNWVGDAVMCVPALQALRESYPDAHIAVLAKPWVAGLYGREPFCDELIPYSIPAGLSGILARWRLAQELRRRRFDCAVLLPNAFGSAALVRAAGIPIRIGYSRDARAWLLTNALPVPKPSEIRPHQRFYYLELLKRASLISSYGDRAIRLSGAQSAAIRGREHFAHAGISMPVIGVSPGAAYGGAKRWLPERFASAAVAVASELNASVAVFGSTQEHSICEEVHRSVSESGVRSVNFAGQTSLDKFIEMAAACEAYLTNDSGPMHIASALGLPTVAIFGATDHDATGPTGASSRVIREPVECSPCLRRECNIDHRCMTRVHANRVAEAALSLITIQQSSTRNR